MIGAIGILVVGTVAAIFCAVTPGAQSFAYTIMSTAVSMATTVCYGDFGAAMMSLAIGYPFEPCYN